jgi:hypothetical protein
VRQRIRSAGAKPVIPLRPNRRTRPHDRQRYELRNVVERFINRIEHFRSVAARYEKLAVTILGFVQFASIVDLMANVIRTKVSHVHGVVEILRRGCRVSGKGGHPLSQPDLDAKLIRANKSALAPGANSSVADANGSDYG